tara:strand:+ start:152 stop:1384 length:1233 start_codon:yes stop_codon:yes gene_type:complete
MGDKMTRALIRFSHSCVIEPSSEAVRYFLAHGARMAGLDKINLNDQIQWVMRNRERIIECSIDPISDLWWVQPCEEDGEPWLFLAWMMEAGDFLLHGKAFESHLPISFDATCSALQHWSMALRDEEGAKRVNLIDGDRADVYTEVLNVLKKKVDQVWLDSPYLTRKLCKTPAMARTYGGTRMGVNRHVYKIIHQLDAGRYLRDHFRDSDIPREMVRLGELIWESIDESLTGATAGMDFAVDVARIANRLGIPLRWVTPTGFQVQMNYQNFKKTRITTRLLGSIYRPTSYVPTETLDKRRQCQAVAPNLIHSADAAFLQKVVANLEFDLVTIHDSFSCLATNAERLNQVLRSEFCKLYDSNFLVDWYQDVLPREILQDVPRPAAQLLEDLTLPQLGNLDIVDVISARYAFS